MSGVVFEWDPAKAVANFAKHGVTFEEALTVFMDPIARIHGDPDHSKAEAREIIVGHSIHQRLLLVSFVERGEKVRSSAPGPLRRPSDEIMKKKTRSRKTADSDDLRREYRFDYRRAKPNRFAAQFATGSVAVVLDPDVASVFQTSDSVNALLAIRARGDATVSSAKCDATTWV